MEVVTVRRLIVTTNAGIIRLTTDGQGFVYYSWRFYVEDSETANEASPKRLYVGKWSQAFDRLCIHILQELLVVIWLITTQRFESEGAQ